MRERLSNNKKLITLLLDVWTEWGHSNHWGLWWDASGFKGHLAFLVAQRVKRLPVTHKTRVRSLGWEDPQRRKWQPTLVFLPGKIPWTEKYGRLQSMGLQKSQTLLSNFTFTWLSSSSDSKDSVCNVGDPDSIPGLGRSPGEGHGTPLQHSCLENSMDRGAWRVTVHGVTKSWTRLSDQQLEISHSFQRQVTIL